MAISMIAKVMPNLSTRKSIDALDQRLPAERVFIARFVFVFVFALGLRPKPIDFASAERAAA